MFERKRKTKDPCEICRLHRALCICDQIPKLSLRTKVTLIVHAKELKRTTNTGQLALHALTNSEMRVRGVQGQALDLKSSLSSEYQTILLYPSEGALELKDFPLDGRPVHLLVPDGNWRQASKVAIRYPELAQIPRVKMSERNEGAQHLRHEHFAEGLSTLEAIAQALGILETPSARSSLLALYQAKLSATLKGRPKSPPEKSQEKR
jgi:DTW domain-containing protein